MPTRSTCLVLREILAFYRGHAPLVAMLCPGIVTDFAAPEFSTCKISSAPFLVLSCPMVRMAEEKQGKFRLIKGGAGEVKPPEPPKPMPKWQWAVLWIGSLGIWFLLFYYFWLALRQ